MKSRSPRRASSRSKAGNTTRRGTHASEASEELDEITARAAGLGITVERVLQEYARIAFVDPRHIVEWDETGLHVKEGLSEADAASISEIAVGSSGKGPVRVKLYDKKAALDAIARHLGMFPTKPRPHEDAAPADTAEDAREVLARRLARLAAGRAAT